MGTTLDGKYLFDEQNLEVLPQALGRKSVERSVPGLDGVLSIDLGMRSRKIRQVGVLRGGSGLKLNERISAISAYMDGDTHTLVTAGGQEFRNLRMDTLEIRKASASGGGAAADYEIVYTQLMV
jgi:hypothetical protein